MADQPRRLSDLLTFEDGDPFTMGEICTVLGYSPDLVRRELQSGHLRGYRTPGGHWRAPYRELRAYAVRVGALPHTLPNSPQTA